MNARGQAGFEYLIFTAFLLLVTAILFGYSFISYSSTVQSIQAQAAVDEVASAVDFVYAKGPGNSIIVDLKLPQGLSSFTVDRNVVRVRLAQWNGTSDYFTFTKATINTNFLLFEEGLYSLRVAMGDSNVSVNNI